MIQLVILMLSPVPFFVGLGLVVWLAHLPAWAVRFLRHREAPPPEPEFCLDGISETNQQRFKAALLDLCGEMAREAARADKRNLSEGTNT